MPPDKKPDANMNQSSEPTRDGDRKSDSEAKEEEEPEIVKFSPEEEEELLNESNGHKSEANALFNKGSYTEALAKYSDATAVCPNYLDYDLAVLQSNISACHLKLQEWKDAITSATAALDKLDKVERELLAADEAAEAEAKAKKQQEEQDEEDVEEEIVSSGAANAGPALSPGGGEEEEEDPAVTARRKRKADVARIRYKALMRRARARSEAGGWSNLAGAEEDYKRLSKMDNVTPGDRKIVAAQLRTLPARTKEAQERETAEMWGKLKELGNGILKPFGLSTDNFQMQKDEKTGGYSMNFQQS